MEYFPSSPQQAVNSLTTDFAQAFPHLVESANFFYWSSSHGWAGHYLSREPRSATARCIPAPLLDGGEPLYIVKLFAGPSWSPSWLGLAHTSSQQTPCVETLTHLSLSGASHEDGAVFIMDENCLLLWFTSHRYSKNRLRDVVQRGLDRIQDDLSEYSKTDIDTASPDVLGPITLDFDNARSEIFNMSNFFEADGLSDIDSMEPSSSYGSPVSTASPFISITSPLMQGCDFLLSSPPGFQNWRSPVNILSTFSSPCVDPRLISPSMPTQEDVVDNTLPISSSPFSSGSSAGGDELSDVGTPYSPPSPSPLPSPKQERVDVEDETMSGSSLSPSRLLEPPSTKSPRVRAKRASPPYRKPAASHKSNKKQRFVCKCGKSYSRDKDRERHQETSCDLIAVKPTVVCDVCHDVLGARPDALLRHKSSARCNPYKRSKAIV